MKKPKKTRGSKFYTFRQNNSGGHFHFDKKAGISVNVIIEAASKEEAYSTAERIGLYFDGVCAGSDCECCGDRWNKWVDPTPKPMIYSIDVSGGVYKPKESYMRGWSKDGIEGYIHYISGEIIPIRQEKTE